MRPSDIRLATREETRKLRASLQKERERARRLRAQAAQAVSRSKQVVRESEALLAERSPPAATPRVTLRGGKLPVESLEDR